MLQRPKITVKLFYEADKGDPLIQIIRVGIQASRDGVDWAWLGPRVVADTLAHDELPLAYARAFEGAVDAMLDDPHAAEFVREV